MRQINTVNMPIRKHVFYNQINPDDNDKLSLYGVYKIAHKQYPNKIYIGSTSSLKGKGGFYDRWRRHYADLKTQKHCNDKLQNMVNKYGIDGLEFSIIEVCKNDECLNKEQFWIDELKPYYNIAKFAGNTLGVKPTLSHIKKRSKAVLQYGLDGNFIKEHINAGFIEEEFGYNKGSIQQCCYNKNSASSHGFQWRYKMENYPLVIPKYENRLCDKIILYNLNGEFIKEYSSLLESSLDLNIPTGNISKHLNGIFDKCYNYIFKYYSENYPLKIEVNPIGHKNQLKITMTNLTTNEIKIFNSFREAGKNGFNREYFSVRVNKGLYEFDYKKQYKVKIEKFK